MSTLHAIAAEVQAWYDRYVDVFTALAAAERDDLAALLAYFGTPRVIVTDDHYVVASTHEGVLSTAQALIDRLRQANYAGSTVHRLDVRLLNARAALIDGAISRSDRAGNEFERFGTTYLAAKTDEGWRFTAIVFTLP